VRCEDAIKIVAFSLDVFDLEADSDGNYAVRLPDGIPVRLLVRPGDQIVFEAQLLEEVTEVVRSSEALLQLLKENLPRSMVRSTVLTYVKDLDELVLSQLLFLQNCEEDVLVEWVESFVEEARALSCQVRALFSPNGSLPSNPFAR
jgi:hypothetical protein